MFLVKRLSFSIALGLQLSEKLVLAIGRVARDRVVRVRRFELLALFALKLFADRLGNRREARQDSVLLPFRFLNIDARYRRRANERPQSLGDFFYVVKRTRSPSGEKVIPARDWAQPR
jgi:hypothetical protein